jgi:aspartyl-tRNA(Asn)/glutamyl-tRNA(Gln) amidotransferase subunit B
VVQETRLFDAAQGKTYSMRSKEEAHDYRYFPEPDLPPLVVGNARRDALRDQLPELPEARRVRFQSAYGLPAYDAALLTDTRDLSEYFEATAAACGQPKAASNWVMGEVLRTLKARATTIDQVGVSAAALAGLIAIVDAGTISTTVAKSVFDQMDGTGRAAADIVASQGLAQVSDEGVLSRVVTDVLAAHGDAVQQYRAGKKAAFGYLVGEAMKASGGNADPRRLSQLLRSTLDG